MNKGMLITVGKLLIGATVMIGGDIVGRGIMKEPTAKLSTIVAEQIKKLPKKGA